MHTVASRWSYDCLQPVHLPRIVIVVRSEPAKESCKAFADYLEDLKTGELHNGHIIAYCDGKLCVWEYDARNGDQPPMWKSVNRDESFIAGLDIKQHTTNVYAVYKKSPEGEFASDCLTGVEWVCSPAAFVDHA